MEFHAPTHRLLHDVIFISFPGHVLSSEHGHQIPWKSQVTELFGRQPLGAQNRWLRAPYVPGKASEDVSFGARVLQRCVGTIITDRKKKSKWKTWKTCMILLPRNVRSHICRLWYIGSYTIMAKPIKSLELHYPMIQFFIISYNPSNNFFRLSLDKTDDLIQN